MFDLVMAESADSRIERAKRLIQQARFARISADARIQFLQDQMDLTKRADGAAVDLTHLIDGMSDPGDVGSDQGKGPAVTSRA